MRFAKGPPIAMLLFCASLPRVCQAQLLSCTVSTTGVQFRTEAEADPIGDVLFRCALAQQPPAGQSYAIADSIQIFLNTNIVNRVIAAPGDAVTTDAVLIINGNDAPPTATSTLGGPANNVPVPQFGQLAVVPNFGLTTNGLEWDGVQIPIPNAKAPDGTTFPSETTIRITNVRCNPIQLGGVGSLIALYSAAVSDAAQVQGIEKITPLGILSQGLAGKTTAAPTLAQCQQLNIVNGIVSGPPTFTVTFTEGFEYAFRPLGQPSTDQGVHTGEDGYPTPGIGANGGGADQGTRLVLNLAN